jgi:hypothetical protein
MILQRTEGKKFDQPMGRSPFRNTKAAPSSLDRERQTGKESQKSIRFRLQKILAGRAREH